MKPANVPPLQQLYTTHDVARMTQMDPSTISKWMNQGKLTGFKTPGGHRRVRGEDLVAFLREYRMPIPPELEQPKAAPATPPGPPPKLPPGRPVGRGR